MSESGQFWYNLLNAGWFGLTVGALIAVIGITVSIVLYHRAKQFTSLRTFQTVYPIIETPHESDGLSVTFDGVPVSRVSKNTVAFWNDGTSTVRGADIVNTDPLRLELTSDGEILRAEISAQSRAVCDAKVHMLSSDTVALTFDFLDRRDSFNLTVVHSGAPDDLRIEGTIRGLPSGITTFDPHRRSRWMTAVLTGSALLVGLFSSFASLIETSPWALLIIPGAAAFIFGLNWILGRVESRSARKRPRIRGVPAAVTSDPNLALWPGWRPDDIANDKPKE